MLVRDLCLDKSPAPSNSRVVELRAAPLGATGICAKGKGATRVGELTRGNDMRKKTPESATHHEVNACRMPQHSPHPNTDLKLLCFPRNQLSRHRPATAYVCEPD